MSIRALLIASAILAAAAASHRSSCSAIWFFKSPCSEAAGALASRAAAWSAEGCTYEVTEESPAALGLRRTCLGRRAATTDMAFDFTPPSGRVFCKVRARSTTTAAPPAAHGPNDYCLLRGSMHGSGGYKEICTEAMCPSKESATCNDGEYTL